MFVAEHRRLFHLRQGSNSLKRKAKHNVQCATYRRARTALLFPFQAKHATQALVSARGQTAQLWLFQAKHTNTSSVLDARQVVVECAFVFNDAAALARSVQHVQSPIFAPVGNALVRIVQSCA